MLDGNLNTQLMGGYNTSTTDSDLTWTPPVGKYVVGNASGDLQVYAGYFTSITVNGTSAATGTGNQVVGWVTLTHTGAITSIKLENTNGTGNVVRANVFKVNGALVDEGLSEDKSGLSNDWAVSNLGLEDAFVDSPINGNEASTGAGGERRGNYCTWNPLDQKNATLTKGNLDCSLPAHASNYTRGTISVTSGKWYWEVTLNSGVHGMIGISDQHYVNGGTQISYAHGVLHYYVSNGSIYGDVGRSGTYSSYGSGLAAGDILGVALDMDNGNVVFYKNGTAEGGNANSSTLVGLTISPCLGEGGGAMTTSTNFGQKSFSYTPPAGYSPLATSFLPESTIKRGDEAMDAALWTGNGANQTISNLNLSPDLLWIKCRNVGHNNSLFDVIRGGTKLLISNSTGAELTYTNPDPVVSFNDDGFELGGFITTNALNNTHVGWVWDAGEATTTISAGGLNSLAYNQTQTWSGNISTTGNSNTFHSSYPATNAFNNNDSNYAHGNGDGSQTAVVTLTLSPGVSCSNTVTFLGGMTGSGTATISVNGGTAVNLTSGSSATTKTNVAFSGTVTSIVITKTSSDASGMLIYGFEIDNTRLVDNGVSVTNVPSTAADLRARPDAGFSLVFWQAQASAATVPHGLGKKAHFIVMKSRNHSNSPWLIYHKDLGSSQYLDFHSAAPTGNNLVFTDEPTSVAFSPGNGIVNSSVYGQMIAYCWSEVNDYSRFTSFTGRGGDVFVYLGFKPRVIWFKNADQAANWLCYDTARNPSNPANFSLQLDDSNNDTTVTNDDIDILSNGFNVKATRADLTGTGNQILIAAWAEHPFASNARAR